MEFMKLFVNKSQEQKTNHNENKIYREQDHLDRKERLDRFPLKTDCEINCIKKPHFPCKGMHTTEPKPRRLFLACDRRNSYPAPPVTSPSPSYPANHPWFEPELYETVLLEALEEEIEEQSAAVEARYKAYLSEFGQEKKDVVPKNNN